ncbi:MAG: hypothetical protein JXR03_09750 [Cyclobacteriaceae bacterium]
MKLSKQLDNKITYLGLYQMIGGGLGIIINTWLLINTGYITGAAVFALLISYGLFGFSIYCGNLLHKSEYDKGLSLSKINQALQVIKFSILGYGYKYISGFMIMIGFDITNNFEFTFEFSLSSWRITLNSYELLGIVGINLVAAFLIWFIGKLQNDIEKHQELLNPIEMENNSAQQKLTLRNKHNR